jgi:uncharacterized protein YbcV (DUF1398 family)
MFTITRIQGAGKKVKSGADFPGLVQELKAMGVIYYENQVEDGRTKYFGEDNFTLDGGSKYRLLTINNKASSVKLKQALSIHQQGKTDYLTFCAQAAEAGVERWVTHLIEMKVTYFDKKTKSCLRNQYQFLETASKIKNL